MVCKAQQTYVLILTDPYFIPHCSVFTLLWEYLETIIQVISKFAQQWTTTRTSNLVL